METSSTRSILHAEEEPKHLSKYPPDKSHSTFDLLCPLLWADYNEDACGVQAGPEERPSNSVDYFQWWNRRNLVLMAVGDAGAFFPYCNVIDPIPLLAVPRGGLRLSPANRDVLPAQNCAHSGPGFSHYPPQARRRREIEPS